MAVGLPSGITEMLGEAAAVVGDAGSGASAAPLTVMVPSSRGLPERKPQNKRRAGLETGNTMLASFQCQQQHQKEPSRLYIPLQNVTRP